MRFSPMRIYTFKMKFVKVIFPLIVLFSLLTGCEREDGPCDDGYKDSGESTVTITLNTSPATKTAGAKDGDVMNTLHIWIADGVGNIIYKGYYDGISVSGEKFTFALADDKKTATATFENVERGDYMMYVVANLPASLSELAAKTSADAGFTDAVLPSLNAVNRPPFGDDDGMPLSMRQMIHVGPGVNTIETQLVRVCGRIRVTVRNMTTDKNIFLQSFKLTDKNPSTGYLFHKDDHGIPAGTTFGKFDSFGLTGTMATRYIAPGDDDTYIDQYLYETGLTGMGTLGFEIIGGIYDSTLKEAQIEDVVVSTTYSQGSVIMSDYNTTTDYLIVNNAGNYYMYNNSGNPGLKYLDNNGLSGLISAGSSDGIDISNFLWKFTSKENTSGIVNQGDVKRWLTTSGNNNVIFTTTTSAMNVHVSNSGIRFYNNNNYYIYNNNGNLGLRSENSTTSNRYWKLIPVTKSTVTEKQLKGAKKNFSKKNNSISYIDQYGLPVTLEHICRNDDVNVIINVFYSPESGVLYFEVEDWEDVSNETTFD